MCYLWRKELAYTVRPASKDLALITPAALCNQLPIFARPTGSYKTRAQVEREGTWSALAEC